MLYRVLLDKRSIVFMLHNSLHASKNRKRLYWPLVRGTNTEKQT